MLNNNKNYCSSIVLNVNISDIKLLLQTVRIVFLFYRTFIAKTYAGFIDIALKSFTNMHTLILKQKPLY